MHTKGLRITCTNDLNLVSKTWSGLSPEFFMPSMKDEYVSL